MNLIIKDPDQGKKLYLYFDGKEWIEKWEVSEEASQLVMDNHLQELDPIRNKVLNGELSPLAYHLERNFFSIALMASYTGISKRHIKKHLNPKNFNQLNKETLEKYAAAFGFSVEEFLKV